MGEGVGGGGGEVNFYTFTAGQLPWVPKLLLIQKSIKSVRIKLPTQSMHQSETIKIKLITMINKNEYWLILLCARVN